MITPGPGSKSTIAALNDLFYVGLSETFKSVVTFQLVDGGSWNGTITFQGTLDGTNFVSVLATNATSGTAATTATAAGIYTIQAAGMQGVQAKGTTVSAGSMVLTAAVSSDK